MKQLTLLFALTLPFLAKAGGPYVAPSLVPQYIEGTTTSGNQNRVPFWFWGDVGGLAPNATYHYFPAMDTANPSISSNGAGNLLLINPYNGVIRRSTNPAMTAYTGYDSLVADANGHIKGWFGVEPTGNARFTPGDTLYPKLMLNDGAGGTTVFYKINFSAYPVRVLNFGTTSMSNTQGSALFDSLDAQPKNFIALYDNTGATGRPVSIAIVENDSLDLNSVAQYAPFYRNQVDSMSFHWGTIVPNNLPNGVQALVEMNFIDGTAVDTTMDADGIWCSGLNTVNMTNGAQPRFLNSTFVLSSSAVIPDTTWTGLSSTFTGSSNDPNATYDWDYGDLSTDTGAVTTHTYSVPGIYSATLVVNTGGCSDTITQTVVVMLSTAVPSIPHLYFGLMPNPTNGEFLLTTKDQHLKTISITNMLGQEIFSTQTEENSVHLDLTGNTTGVYFVRVKDEITGITGIKKVVLQ